MTLADAIADLEKVLSYDLDNYLGEAPSEADAIRLLNWGLREVGALAFLYGEAALTLVAGQAEYSLLSPDAVSLRIVLPHKVGIRLSSTARVTLRDSRGGYGLWDAHEFTARFPDWRDAPAGEPFIAVSLPGDKIRLHLPPSEAVAELNGHFVEGQYLPPDLTPGVMNDQLPITFELHDAVVRMAAVHAAEPFVSEGEAAARIAGFRQYSVTEAKRIGRRNQLAIAPKATNVQPRRFKRI